MNKRVNNNKRMDNSIYAVLLAGGKGERFWPKSRRDLPKQLLNIIDDRTMVETTIERISPLIPSERIFIVAREQIKDNLLNINLKIPSENYLFEPKGRNTAPAIGLAAFNLFKIDKESVMVVLPCDHYITEAEEFLDCIRLAVKISKRGYLVTFGIVPSRPETGYGYIESGKKIEDGVCEVKRFKEKPSQKKATEFIKKENFLWNSGIFIWETKTIVDNFRHYLPKFTREIEIYNETKDRSEREKLIRKIYRKTEPISIDYAVMEKASKVAVVRASFGWGDVGSWTAIERLSKKDKNGNTVIGDAISLDTKDSIIVADKGVVGTIGISNLVVVHTKDATLVLPKNRAQDVKEIVRKLHNQERLKKYT